MTARAGRRSAARHPNKWKDDKIPAARPAPEIRAEPRDADGSDAYDYIEDVGLLISDGMIEASVTYGELSIPADAHVIDHRPNLLMAGFIDAHLHFPQIQLVAS